MTIVIAYIIFSGIRPKEYFFIKDPEFFSGLDNFQWKDSIWNPQGGSYVKMQNGILELFYNETEGIDWGNSQVFQGEYPRHQAKWGSLLVGENEETAEEREDGVTFDEKIPEETFWLKAKFKVISRKFNVDPVDDDPKGNIGLEVLCQFNDADYDKDFALRIGVMFGGFVWNGTTFNEVAKGTEWKMNGTTYDPDLHFLTWVHEITEVGEWQSVVIDYGKIFNRVFDAFEGDGLKSMTIRGLQLFAEGIGIQVKTQFDSVKTEII